MSKKIEFAAIAMAFAIISTAWALPVYADNGTSITFDLNGGTMGGAGTFVMTAEDLADGLPGADDFTVPAGRDEFVVWSTSTSNYEHLYNPGDPAPDVTTLYAIWGIALDGSANMTIPGSGCYIIENSSGRTLEVPSSTANGALVVLRNVNLTKMTVTTNVTFITQGTNTVNEYAGWNNYRLEFSSASTGSISINSALSISGPLVLRGNITVTGVIRGSSIDIDGNVETSHIESAGPVVLRGDVKTSGKIQGSSIDIDGNVDAGAEIFTGGQLTIRGNVKATGKIQGINGIDIDGNVETDSFMDSGGPITLKGEVSVAGSINGRSDIILEGTVSAGSVYTGNDISIDGNITIDGRIQGGNIDVKGTLVAGDLYTGGSLTINDSAVVKVGDTEYPQPGKEYITFVTPTFDIDGVTDIIASFDINDNGNVISISIILPSFEDKIYLGSGVFVVEENGHPKIDVFFTQGGKRWHSVGAVTYTSATQTEPGYYTCTLGEPQDVTEPDPDEEPDLVFISAPPSFTSGMYVRFNEGISVKLIFTETGLYVDDSDNDVITIFIPDSADIYGYWGSLDIMTPDDGKDDEYTIIDEGFEPCGTFVLFVILGEQTVPICLVIIPDIGFDTTLPGLA